jgi:hypothetical protein
LIEVKMVNFPNDAVGVKNALFDTVSKRTGSTKPAYLGYVATRCGVNNAFNADIKQIMASTHHYARDDITALTVGFDNWWVDGLTQQEKNTGGVMTVEASVEYPIGSTPKRFKFGGQNSGTIPNGESKNSDALSVTIPRGSAFKIRRWSSNPAGSGFTTVSDPLSYDAMDSGASVYNAVLGGTVTHYAGYNVALPSRILGMTTRPSVICYGDSICQGTDDKHNSDAGDFGIIAKSIGPHFGYINSGIGTDRVEGFLASGAKRRTHAAYASTIISNYGINSLFSAGHEGDVVAADCVAMAALFPGKPFWQCTATPLSSGSYTTSAAQGVDYAGNLRRTAFNKKVRAILPGHVGFFDTAAPLELSIDTGRWSWGIAGWDGSPLGYTDDGVHPNWNGYYRVQSSGVINPALIYQFG